MATIWLDLDGVIFKGLKNIALYENPRIFSSLELIDGAEDFIEKLKSLGKVKVISKVFLNSTDPNWRIQAYDKIISCVELGFDPSDVVILTAEQEKFPYMKKGDLLIDDYGENCRKAMRKNIQVIQGFENKERKKWVTAKDYPEILRKTKKYIKIKEVVKNVFTDNRHHY